MKSIIKAIKETSWTVRILVIIGIGLCSIPLISSIHSDIQQNNMISTYESEVKQTDKSKVKEQIQSAQKYNDMLYQTRGASVGNIDTEILSDENYESILNLTGKGIMGSIEIPKIGVDLPIYHGTSDDVLLNGVGHLQNSSFPVGGENTRTVLTGHRGLPNAKLFTRLDELKKDDLFYIHVGNKTLAYQIYKIEIVKKEEAPDVLGIEEGKDLATLLTCTPYGINTHRLILTGKRVPYSEKKKEAIEPEMMSWRELLFTALPFLIVFMLIVRFIFNKRKERKLKS